MRASGLPIRAAWVVAALAATSCTSQHAVPARAPATSPSVVVSTTGTSTPSTNAAPVVPSGSPVAGPGASGGVSFVSSGLGFGLARGPQLVQSHDGGRTWRAVGGRIPISTEASGYAQVMFASATTGFVFADGIVVTHDGGQTWEPIRVNGVVHSMAIRDGRGWAVSDGCGGQCLFSGLTDGGSWTQVFSGQGVFGSQVALASGGAFFSDGAMLARTVDGGKTWRHLSLPKCSWGPAVAVAALTMRHLWVACFAIGADAVPVSWYESTDGASTWRIRAATANPDGAPAVGTPASFDHVGDFVVRPDGTLVMTGFKIGSVWLSFDGGAHWKMTFADDGGGGYSIQFTDNHTGWIESVAAIYRTFDGGLHWTKVLSTTE